MKKKSRVMIVAAAGLLQMAQAYAAQDFSRLSNEELTRLQNQSRYMNQENRSAYRTERQNRLRDSSRIDNSASGAQQRAQSRTQTRQRLRDGSGGGYGSGNRGGYSGNTMGQRGGGSSYGRGYGYPRGGGGGGGGRSGGGRR